MDSEWPLTREKVMTHFRLSDLDYQEMLADLLDEYEMQFGALGS
jgi:hypothetical protein